MLSCDHGAEQYLDTLDDADQPIKACKKCWPSLFESDREIRVLNRKITMAEERELKALRTLEELSLETAALRKIYEAAKEYMEGQWREGFETIMQEAEPDKYGKSRRALFMEALIAYEKGTK